MYLRTCGLGLVVIRMQPKVVRLLTSRKKKPAHTTTTIRYSTTPFNHHQLHLPKNLHSLCFGYKLSTRPSFPNIDNARLLHQAQFLLPNIKHELYPSLLDGPSRSPPTVYPLSIIACWFSFQTLSHQYRIPPGRSLLSQSPSGRKLYGHASKADLVAFETKKVTLPIGLDSGLVDNLDMGIV